MSTFILHGFPISSYVRTCRLTLAEKGVDYELDPAPPQSPEQLARHPWGKVPAMTHGDVELYESLAITHYIDEAFDGPALQPVGPTGRARMHQWISVFDCYLYRPAIDMVIQRLVVGSQGGTANEELIASSIPMAEKALGVFDRALSGSVYLVGDSLTLADLFLLPVTDYLAKTAPEGESLLAKTGNINRWQEAMIARASAQQVLQ